MKSKWACEKGPHMMPELLEETRSCRTRKLRIFHYSRGVMHLKFQNTVTNCNVCYSYRAETAGTCATTAPGLEDKEPCAAHNDALCALVFRSFT